MKILQKAPALAILAAVASGFALYEKFGAPVMFAGTIGIFAGVCLCTYTENFSGKEKIFFAGLIIALLCSWRGGAEFSRPGQKDENISFHNETGTITNLRTWGKIYVAIIETQHYGKFALKMQFAELMTGTRIKFDGVTENFKEAQAPGKFSERNFFFAQGARAWVKISNVRELPEKFSLSRFRYILSRKLTMLLPPLTAAYLRAAWLGERSEILTLNHRNWGTSHLLAVSGFHVGIVIGAASLFFGGHSIILSIIMWLYVLLTGAAPSALRAALMIQIALASKIFHRRVNGINSVAVAGILLLVWRPFLFWDIGFRLSVLCALVIASTPKKFFLLASPAAWLVSFPQAAKTFGGVPLVGLILNLAAPFYFSGAFMTASLCAILKIIRFPVSALFVSICEGIFLRFEITANNFVNVLPIIMPWNFFTAWLGVGVLFFCVCKSLELSTPHAIAITCGGSFAAFMMFM